MTRTSRAPAALLVIALLLTALVGCSRGDNALDGTQWRLAGWTLSSLSPADFTITAKFADGRLSGNSGVNFYSGPYRLGSRNAFTAGPLAGTEMAGPEPAMRAESAYMTLLRQSRSYELAEGKLTDAHSAQHGSGRRWWYVPLRGRVRGGRGQWKRADR